MTTKTGSGLLLDFSSRGRVAWLQTYRKALFLSIGHIYDTFKRRLYVLKRYYAERIDLHVTLEIREFDVVDSRHGR